MPYVLETPEEFERLERQSQHPNFDFRVELEGFDFSKDHFVLDAGCGSGLLTRYLAQKYPQNDFTGVDLSSDRIEGAKLASQLLKNTHFQVSALDATLFPTNHFDSIVCRYVAQHLNASLRAKVLLELFRILKPGGRLILIDTDGLIANLWPTPPPIENTLPLVVAKSPVDLFVGRKLPSELIESGGSNIHWKIQTTECHGTSITDQTEIAMMSERLTFATPAIAKILGGNEAANEFIDSYIQAMSAPGAVYFQNKFIVTATKPQQNFLKLVETENESK